MLSDLKINNYAVAKNLDIEFNKGLTTITGETGAGKSIMIDALALALGARADSNSVKPKADKAEISASFCIDNNPAAIQWLIDKNLDADGECILRRSISKDGKSKAFINGVASPLQDLKQIAEHLINIHSQHQHQSLLKKDNHRKLLDEFCGHQNELDALANKFKAWKNREKALNQLVQNQDERNARIDFLTFQCDELDKIQLQEGEFGSLNIEQNKLANVDEILNHGHLSLQALSDNEEQSALHLLNTAIHELNAIQINDESLKASIDGINNAIIQVEEAKADLNAYVGSLEADPERLAEIDQRIGKIHDLARKHRIKPEEIEDFHQKIADELSNLQGSDMNIESLSEEIEELKADYLQAALKLSEKRKKAAKQLDKSIAKKLIELEMPNCRIKTSIVELSIEEGKAFGLDDIEILIATNPEQSPQPLSKVASGGELSRISLAIQVNFAQKTSTPCLIFDEVDVGIGGSTAEVVGRLLKTLGEHTQVICVTHLPQVAAQGHQHLKVNKQLDRSHVCTRVEALGKQDKVTEIARMLGGVEMTKQTISHAKEMIKLAEAS